MQAFFQSIFKEIKSQLCERRKPKPTINKFAVVQRTNIMVRKPSRGSHVRWNIEGENENKLGRENMLEQHKSQGVINLSQPQRQGEQAQTDKDEGKKRVKQSTYTLKRLIQIEDSKSQSQTQTQQLIMSQLGLCILQSDLNTVLEQITFLQQEDAIRKKEFWKKIYSNYSNQRLDKDLSSLVDEDQQHQDDILNDGTLMKMYQFDIEDVRDFKYSSQLKDYPEISFECYSEIRRLWVQARKNPNFLIKQMKLKILEKLLARSLKTLSFGVWLNDQIINAYLQMIDNKSIQRGKKYRVLNSFFAKTTFSKSSQMISRALKRKNIEPSNQIIIAINNGNHWFFAWIHNSKVTIYDSIPKDPCYYETSDSTSEIFANILNFAQWYYGRQYKIEVDQKYPKQMNSHDCGMFLLCGIKDIVRDYKIWSFQQEDINYKRVLVAKEIIEEQITGFDN